MYLHRSLKAEWYKFFYSRVGRVTGFDEGVVEGFPVDESLLRLDKI